MAFDICVPWLLGWMVLNLTSSKAGQASSCAPRTSCRVTWPKHGTPGDSGVLPALCWDTRDTVPSSCAGLALQGCTVSWLSVSCTSHGGEAAVTLPSKPGFLQIWVNTQSLCLQVLWVKNTEMRSPGSAAALAVLQPSFSQMYSVFPLERQVRPFYLGTAV